MAQLFQVHPDNPQARLLKQAVALLTQGGVLAVPTDSSYALVCHLDDKAAIDRLRQIRGVDEKHHLTLLCRDLRELGVAKFGDHYVIANENAAAAPTNDAFAALAGWVREVLTAGPSLTVIKTNPGSAQSVAVAIDNANWPEVVGTISGDDTLFVATAGAAEQQALVSRLRSLFFKA